MVEERAPDLLPHREQDHSGLPLVRTDEVLLRLRLGGWQRKGECNGCGYCCQFDGSIRLTFDKRSVPPGQFDEGYYKTRGYSVDKEGASKVAFLYQPCPKFEPTASNGVTIERPGRCTVYEDRPKTCRDFPQEPMQLLGTPCSYWFERNNGTRVVRFGGSGSPYPTLEETDQH
jgi:Fe-S-cluster containining protein